MEICIVNAVDIVLNKYLVYRLGNWLGILNLVIPCLLVLVSIAAVFLYIPAESIFLYLESKCVKNKTIKKRQRQRGIVVRLMNELLGYYLLRDNWYEKKIENVQTLIHIIDKNLICPEANFPRAVHKRWKNLKEILLIGKNVDNKFHFDVPDAVKTARSHCEDFWNYYLIRFGGLKVGSLDLEDDFRDLSKKIITYSRYFGDAINFSSGIYRSSLTEKDLSSDLTEKDGKRFISSFFIILIVVSAVEAWIDKSEPKRISEFLSYALPCGAGIMAGCGLFFRGIGSQERKYYLASILLLFLGFVCFAFSRSDSDYLVLAASILTGVAFFYILARRRQSAVKYNLIATIYHDRFLWPPAIMVCLSLVYIISYSIFILTHFRFH